MRFHSSQNLLFKAVCVCAFYLGFVQVLFAQTGTITTVSPDSSEQGTNDLLVMFTLASSPPPPPLDAPLTGAKLGDMSGMNVTRIDDYNVSATFDIPASESVGLKDAQVIFGSMSGDVVFSKSGGFTVTAGADSPPVITQSPQSRSVVVGASVILEVRASGTPPLSYQWQKDQTELPGATDSTYTIDSVSSDDEGDYRCVVTNSFGSDTSSEATLTVVEPSTNSYPVVDTGQTLTYNATTSISPPSSGEAFYGQDAQYEGYPPSYSLSGDALIVIDNVTGLMWQKSPDTDGDGDIDAEDKMTWNEAQAYPGSLNAESFAGYDDWRLPSIKELYSLILFSGTDPSGYEGTDTSGLEPFIDTDYFDFAYGDTDAGERIIDSQYASSTLYVSTTGGGEQTLFGVNFADGRIKGYGLTIMGSDKTFLVICVRGAANYAINNFIDNGDGTITDEATGLMWMQNDSGSGMNWQSALDYAEDFEFAGHNDWRLPNIKELQTLLDYSRSPDTHGTAAIDPIFNCTSIANEAGETDYPYYWSSTTHATYNGMGASASYVAFGRAMGYMNDNWIDVHGAGAQRSDPKEGDPADYPTGHGPQGDAIRIFNHVRLVRNTNTAQQTAVPNWITH